MEIESRFVPSLSALVHNSRDVFLEEVDADGLLVVLGEDALAVALDHARLAHRPVPHDHHLRRQSHTFALDRAAHPMFRVGLRKIPRPFIAHKNPHAQQVYRVLKINASRKMERN